MLQRILVLITPDQSLTHGLLTMSLMFQDYPISDVHTILNKAEELRDNS